MSEYAFTQWLCHRCSHCPQDIALQAVHHGAGLGGAFNALFDAHYREIIPGRACIFVDPACAARTVSSKGVAHCNPDCDLRDASGVRKGGRAALRHLSIYCNTLQMTNLKEAIICEAISPRAARRAQ